jgi:hypothetical protein
VLVTTAQLRDSGAEFPNNNNYSVKGKSKFYYITCHEAIEIEQERWKEGYNLWSDEEQKSASNGNLEEMRGFWKLKETLGRAMWRSCFGRGCGPVVRQYGMNVRLIVLQILWRLTKGRLACKLYLR